MHVSGVADPEPSWWVAPWLRQALPPGCNSQVVIAPSATGALFQWPAHPCRPVQPLRPAASASSASAPDRRWRCASCEPLRGVAPCADGARARACPPSVRRSSACARATTSSCGAIAVGPTAGGGKCMGSGCGNAGTGDGSWRRRRRSAAAGQHWQKLSRDRRQATRQLGKDSGEDHRPPPVMAGSTFDAPPMMTGRSDASGASAARNGKPSGLPRPS